MIEKIQAFIFGGEISIFKAITISVIFLAKTWAKLFSVKSWRHRTSFFDATPVGRILNRFSSDLYTVDDSLPFILNIFLARLFAVFGVLVICVYSVPWIVLLLVPLGFVYYDVQGSCYHGFL